MKLLCRNCHFLAKKFRDSSVLLLNSLSKDERDKAKQGIIDFFDSKCCIKCHMGVWDEGVHPGKDQRMDRINKDKRDKCFFFPYDPGMMFDAAKELQKRQQEYQQLKKSNTYTRIGLWIASLALITNTIISILAKMSFKP